MALLFVALGAILVWFLIAPFLKTSPTTTPASYDPRVTCGLCDELREPDDVIEREFGAGRYHYVCGSCLASMVDEFHSQHDRAPGPAESAPS